MLVETLFYLHFLQKTFKRDGHKVGNSANLDPSRYIKKTTLYRGVGSFTLQNISKFYTVKKEKIMPRKRKTRHKKLLFYSLIICGFLALSITFAYFYFLEDLPDYKSLEKYEPPIVTRLYASDGNMFAEYATEKRIFIPFKSIPTLIINAFLAVEDKNFYRHKGLDYMGIFRALLSNIRNHLTGKKSLAGGSTITQQVAKNFLLTNEKTLARKIKEALLAFRIERGFSKDKILELYLNEIYLGNHAYGIASAAWQYFNKPLNDLTVAEAAYLATLPKAPNFYSAKRHPEAALNRRNWVIQRMAEENFITEEQAQDAILAPLIEPRPEKKMELIRADHCAELVRQYLYENFGESSLYKGGLIVKTTLDSKLQQYAHESLQEALVGQDRKMGWRGPLTHIEIEEWQKELSQLKTNLPIPKWNIAVILQLSKKQAFIGIRGGDQGIIPLEKMKWARPYVPPNGTTKYPTVGPTPKSIEDVVKVGDVVVVKKLENNTYSLEQIPEINGALIAMDPYTGRVVAMEGGFSFARSQFNWVTQAHRQTGSAFKPFVYLAGLENGFTPNSILQDDPIEVDMGPSLGLWKPVNITEKTFGSVTLRTALEKSLNLATVWLGMQIGISPIQEIARKFGIYETVPQEMAIVLGSLETTLLKMTTAYAMLANGGHPITPKFIDRIQDRYGKTIYRSDAAWQQEKWAEHVQPPYFSFDTPSIADPVAIYQILSILQGAVQRGASRNAKVPGHAVAGKTGTSNDYNDAWFVGTTPSLTVGILIGFDRPKSLGRYETGARVAAPIFASFMHKALKDTPNLPYPFPNNARLEWVDLQTGKRAPVNGENAILEVFQPSHDAPSTDLTGN